MSTIMAAFRQIPQYSMIMTEKHVNHTKRYLVFRNRLAVLMISQSGIENFYSCFQSFIRMWRGNNASF